MTKAYTIKDFYNYYLSYISDNPLYNIDYKTYRSILTDYFKFIRDEIIEELVKSKGRFAIYNCSDLNNYNTISSDPKVNLEVGYLVYMVTVYDKAGNQKEVRHRAQDAAFGRREGYRRRGPDCRRKRRRHHDEGGLREAPSRDHLSPAEARRQGHAGRELEGQRLRRAPVRRLDAFLYAVLLDCGQGISPEGV